MNNAICKVCGKPYHRCMSCDTERKLYPYKSIADSQNCYKLFYIISNYYNKTITKDEAYEQLQNCDISDYKNFLPHNVKMIDEILGNATIIKETKSTKSESLEENDKEEVKETIDKEDTVVKKTNTKKKYSK